MNKAEQIYQKAGEKENNHRKGLLIDKADLYSELGQHSKALECLELAKSIKFKLTPSDIECITEIELKAAVAA